MTDLANLVIGIDSTDVKTGVGELDKLTAAGTKAEGAVDRLGDSAAQSGKQIKGAAQQAAEYAAEVQRMAGISVGSMDKTAGATKLAGYQVQNLAYQFNDLFVGLASGQKPMTVFMQQGSQIGQIMMQAGLGVGGLVSQVGKLVGGFLLANPLLLGLTAAAGVAAAAVGLITSEVNKNSEVTVTWKDVVLGAWDAAKSFLNDELTAAFAYFGTTTGEVWDAVVGYTRTAVNAIIGLTTLVPREALKAFSTLPAAIGDAFFSGVNAAIKAINWLLQSSVNAINSFSSLINEIPLMGAAGFKIPTLSAPQIKEVANNFAGAGKTFGAAMSQGLNETFSRDFIGEAAAWVKPYAVARAKARLATDEDTKSRKGSTKAAKEESDELKKQIELNEWLAEGEKKAFAEMNKRLIAQGDAYTKATAEAEQFAQALKDVQDKAAQDAANDLLNTYIDQLRIIEQMGGALGQVAGIMEGIKTGDFGGVTGKLGSFLSIASSSVGKDGWKALGKELNTIFGANGSFRDEMKKLMQGAALGSTASSLVLGSSGSSLGSSIGGAIGQKIGEKVFKKLGDFAGPLGGIVGGLLGGVLGGMLKKKVYGTANVTGVDNLAVAGNKGSARGNANTLGGAVQQGVQQIAEMLNGGVGAFNVSIGTYKDKFRVSPGGKTGKLSGGDVVDFGKDGADAAIKYAIADAVKDGAITGLKAGTQKLITATGDIDAQLQKALSFEGVFSDLKAKLDPTGSSLENLTKQFDALRKIFDEAGASAADYAQLEQLLALKRQDLEIEKLNKQRTLEVQLLEAQGNATAALALQRQIELSTTEDWLKNLQSQVYAAQDAAQAQAEMTSALEAAASKFKSFADDLRDFRDSLTGGGNAGLTYRQSMAKLMSVGGLAAAGDETALSKLSGVSSDFLNLAKDQASSNTQFQRDVALVRQYLDQAINTADYMAGNPVATPNAPSTIPGAPAAAANNTVTMAQAMADLRAEVVMLRTAVEAVKGDTGNVSRIMTRVEDAGTIRVSNDSDRPLELTVV